jgi:hypothetical protein
MLIIELPGEMSVPLRYFSSGALNGLAVVLFIFSRRAF